MCIVFCVFDSPCAGKPDLTLDHSKLSVDTSLRVIEIPWDKGSLIAYERGGQLRRINVNIKSKNDEINIRVIFPSKGRYIIEYEKIKTIDESVLGERVQNDKVLGRALVAYWIWVEGQHEKNADDEGWGLALKAIALAKEEFAKEKKPR